MNILNVASLRKKAYSIDYSLVWLLLLYMSECQLKNRDRKAFLAMFQFTPKYFLQRVLKNIKQQNYRNVNTKCILSGCWKLGHLDIEFLTVNFSSLSL